MSLMTKMSLLEINGIVYNEMKGVYSSIDGIASRVTAQSLFPDTTYQYESGGDRSIFRSLLMRNILISIEDIIIRQTALFISTATWI